MRTFLTHASGRRASSQPQSIARGSWLGIEPCCGGFCFFPANARGPWVPWAHRSYGPSLSDPCVSSPKVLIGRPMGSLGPPVVSHGFPWGSNGSHGAPKGLMHWCIWVPMGLHGLYLDICVMVGDKSMSEYVKAENDESTLAGNKISFNQGGLFGAHGPPRSS